MQDCLKVLALRVSKKRTEAQYPHIYAQVRWLLMTFKLPWKKAGLVDKLRLKRYNSRCASNKVVRFVGALNGWYANWLSTLS